MLPSPRVSPPSFVWIAPLRLACSRTTLCCMPVKGNDYLMLDPWPYQPDVKKETYLMPRYSQGNPLQRSILQIVLYENVAADGTISMPGSSPATHHVSHPQPSLLPFRRRAASPCQSRCDLGLNIRTSEDTSSKANIVEVVPAGALLTIIEPGGVSQDRCDQSVAAGADAQRQGRVGRGLVSGKSSRRNTSP